MHFFPDRRKPVIKHDTSLNISKIFIEDVPYLNLLLFSILSISCIAFIYLGSKVIPYPPEKRISRSVDITVHMIEDIKTEPEHLVQKTTPPVKEKEISIKSIKKLFLQKPENKPEPKLLAKTTVNEKTKPITIKKKKLIHEETLPGIISRPKIRQKPSTLVKPLIPGAPIFDNSVRSNEIAMKTPRVRKRKFEISRAQSKLSHFETKTSINQQDNPVQKLFRSNPSQRNYVISGENQRKFLYYQDAGTPVIAFTSGQPVESDEIYLRETDYMERRYLPQKNLRPSESQALPQTKSNVLSLTPQEDTRIQGEELQMPPLPQPRIATKPTTQSEEDLIHAKLHKKALYLSGDITIDDIDPSQLISLNEFDVCIDPQEEFRLKMQLASLLDKPGGCATDATGFFFKYTESAYTIKVDIYDPQGTLSGNRCSVLGRAIECVKN